MSAELPWLEPVRQRLAQWQLGRGLPHALLFAGPPGIGKYSLLQELATALLCQAPQGITACGQCDPCRRPLEHHPDFHALERAPRKDGKGLKLQLTVDVVREAIDEVSKASHAGGNKLFVLREADKLNAAAANALLKTLEEPPGSTYMLLLSDAPGRLLPTVRSRCQVLNCVPPDADALAQWLQAQAVGAELDAAVTDSPGQPLAALERITGGAAARWQENDQLLLNALQRGEPAMGVTDALIKQGNTEVMDWLLIRMRQWCLRCAGQPGQPAVVEALPIVSLQRATQVWRHGLLLREDYRAGATPSARYALDKMLSEWLAAR